MTAQGVRPFLTHAKLLRPALQSLEEHIVAGVALARAAAKWDAEGEPERICQRSVQRRRSGPPFEPAQTYFGLRASVF